jgi:ABC-2 type transport system permease protein
MNFREVFRFELSYQARRISTWLFFTVLFIFAVAVIRAVSIKDARNSGVFLNAPYFITSITVFGSLIWQLIAGVVAGEAATRDLQTRMFPLTYTTPITKADHLGGRFLAAFVLNTLILLAVPAGILFAVYLPGIEPELIGPFRSAAYLTAYSFIALPNAFVITAVQFSWSTLSRRGISAYLASGLLFIISHIGIGGALQFFKRSDLTPALDLVGIMGIVANLDKIGTVLEKNTRLLSFAGALLANRMIWFGIAIALLAVTYARFSFGQRTEIRRRGRKRNKESQSALASTIPAAKIQVSIPQIQREFGMSTYTRQTFAVAMDSFKQIIKIRSGLILVPVFMIAVFLFAQALTRINDVPVIPTTGRILGLLAAQLDALQNPLIIIPLLTIYYAGELTWREREAGLSEIVDTAPVPEWALFLGKFIGLGLVLAVWMIILIGAGIIIQLDRGYHNFEIGLYLKVVLGIQLSNYLLFALLVLVLHIIADQKYLGHLLALGAFGFISFASTLGIRHHLLVYASSPGWSYTDMQGFGSSLAPWLWFRGYWVGWALLLAVSARLFWSRGRNQKITERLRLALLRLTRPTLMVTMLALALVFVLGSFIFYNTNILNKHDATADIQERSVKYEQFYDRYKKITQPSLKSTKLHIELYPEQGEAEIRGFYRLVNNNASTVSSIHVVPAAEVETGEIKFDRPVVTKVLDKDLGYRIYALKTPLRSGDSLQLNFTIKIKRHGFTNNGREDELIALNGTYLRNQDYLPAIGYQSGRELSTQGLRKQYGLGARRAIASLYDAEARKMSFSFDLTDFEAVIGTTKNQTAVGPGELIRSWTKAGRNYFHYRSSAPIQNRYIFFSANYAIKEGIWHSAKDAGSKVLIRILYHPGHPANVERMLRSARASLDYYTEKYGPYPYRHLTIAERGGPGNSLHAEASMIGYSETYALFQPDDSPKGFDLPYYAIAHEVAHQWWGAAQFQPANAEGIAFLAEGLAVYSGMQVLEKKYGSGHMNRYLSFLRESYEVPRTRASLPLLRANNSFLGYRKGPLALYALNNYIGMEQVNKTLRHMLENRNTSSLSTTLDLYKELKAVTPDSLHYLLHDLFEANTFWELKAEKATAKQTGAGNWEVSLHIQTRKIVVDPAGTETEIPMNDLLDIGIYSVDGKPLYLQKQWIRSGNQTITVKVDEKPLRAGIDPNQLMVDLDAGNNTVTIKDY